MTILRSLGFRSPEIATSGHPMPAWWSVETMTKLEISALAYVAIDPAEWVQWVRDWRDDDTEEDQNRIIYDRVQSAIDEIAASERMRLGNIDGARDAMAVSAFAAGLKSARQRHDDETAETARRIAEMDRRPATGPIPDDVITAMTLMARELSDLKAKMAALGTEAARRVAER